MNFGSANGQRDKTGERSVSLFKIAVVVQPTSCGSFRYRSFFATNDPAPTFRRRVVLMMRLLFALKAALILAESILKKGWPLPSSKGQRAIF